jgi:ABC-type Fe3+/spermidine/putrescine transport system ATPase subunit
MNVLADGPRNSTKSSDSELSAAFGGGPPRGRELKIEELTKRYAGVQALAGVTLAVPPGALITLLGPSGCGKTTLMRSIAGFVTPDHGRITVGGRNILPLAPERRSTAMLFQNYSLFPHMTVEANVGFGLRMRRMPRGDVASRVSDVLKLTRITELAARYPDQLSGGQQQRVALARALATQPDILLLDEPFGALDQNLREQVQIELRKLQQSLGITTLVVTHDQLEALTLSDLVAVMNAGRIEQLGSPAEIYDRPATAFVARFMGVENLLPVNVGHTANGQVQLSVGPLTTSVSAPTTGIDSNSSFQLAARADAVRLANPTNPDAVGAQITFASNRGASALYEIKTDDGLILKASEERRGGSLRDIGSRVGIVLVGSACSLVRA